ncbi:MAG: hypothetical protein AAF502_12850 [Bacteroidota bacterium]
MKQLLLFALILLLGSCNLSKVSVRFLNKQKIIYQESTQAIVENNGASVVDKNLANITKADINSEGYVEMLAWKSAQAAEDYYQPVGQLDTLDSKYLTWVTKKSQMLDKSGQLGLNKWKGERLALRLEQVLGLPPNCDTTRKFIEIWVKMDDLFRPCPDPEITDFECDLTDPQGAYSGTPAEYQPVYDYIVSSTEDFPWTRLGYTYDWSTRNSSHFGLSEYVIRQNAVVLIKSKEKTEDWIGKNIR